MIPILSAIKEATLHFVSVNSTYYNKSQPLTKAVFAFVRHQDTVLKQPKQAMRQAVKTLRTSLDIPALSSAICKRIEESGLLVTAQKVCIYYPLADEIDLLPLLQTYPDIEWSFPKTVQSEKGPQILFYPIDHRTQFIPGAFGVLEPTEFWPALIDFSAVDFILMPGMAYDVSGNRLGYGKGMYDQFFKWLETRSSEMQFKGKRIGSCPEATLFESLPADPWDVKAELLYTENAVYQFED